MESCVLCFGLHGHERLKDDLALGLHREFIQAGLEVQRLEALHLEVCWYNFEVHCRDWNGPWHPSYPHSPIALTGYSGSVTHGRECGQWPVYYKGNIWLTPKLPPAIVASELQAARTYMQTLRDARDAVYDYAPGGPGYEQLLRFGEGVKMMK